MTYEDFREQKALKIKAHDVAARELEENFPIDGKMGYTPETLNNSKFRKLFNVERAAFAALRDFNSKAPKTYKRRAAKESRCLVK